ncbi:MAG: OmpH family outer membrane protein [Planctomycetaceae bacterium]|nr:OmpH family outer membrane protein [Planctomycetaceae bacterium]
MNRLIITLVSTILLAGPLAVAQAQETKPSASPHKIALIDISRVLKEYKKVDSLRTEIKGEITKSEQTRRAMVKQSETLKGKLKAPNIEPASAKAVELEKQLLKLEAEFNAFKKSERARILRLEAQLLKTIHGEIKAVVKRAAEAWGYTLVLRFNSDNSNSSNPNTVVGQLQRQVVFYRTDDDITQPVVEYLNKQYSAQVKRPTPPTGTQPAGATKKKTRR